MQMYRDRYVLFANVCPMPTDRCLHINFAICLPQKAKKTLAMTHNTIVKKTFGQSHR